MVKFIAKLSCILIRAGCSAVLGDKHLDEKIYKSGDITAKWYRISDLTSIHDFIDIERWGWTKTIMKANTGAIHDILIKGDTIIIHAKKNLVVYDLTAFTLNCHIKVDTTISMCEYLKKHIPENAKYHCDSVAVDTSRHH